jgi:cytochrome c oxidase subunit 3
MMKTTSTIPIEAAIENPVDAALPRHVGMACLILAESAIFIIFVVAYIFYIGKSLAGRHRRRCWSCRSSAPSACSRAASPFTSPAVRCARTICAAARLSGGNRSAGSDLSRHDGARVVSPDHDEGLTIQTNLFGTTYYSLVGLHATHVVVGLILCVLAGP